MKISTPILLTSICIILGCETEFKNSPLDKWINVGMDSIKNKNFDAAFKLFDGILKTKPNNYEAVMGKCNVVTKTYKTTKLKECIKSIETNIPNKSFQTSSAYYNLGMLQIFEKDFKNAETNMSKALKIVEGKEGKNDIQKILQKNKNDILEAMAIIKMNLGDDNAAKDFFKQATDNNKNYTTTATIAYNYGLFLIINKNSIKQGIDIMQRANTGRLNPSLCALQMAIDYEEQDNNGKQKYPLSKIEKQCAMIDNVDKSEQEKLLIKLKTIRETVEKIENSKNPATDDIKKSLREKIFDYFDSSRTFSIS